jgi:hypothetical protein
MAVRSVQGYREHVHWLEQQHSLRRISRFLPIMDRERRMRLIKF